MFVDILVEGMLVEGIEFVAEDMLELSWLQPVKAKPATAQINDTR
jgi:hypothetical protein